MQLTEKHRKYIWIAAGVIAVVHFLPSYIGQFIPQRTAPIAKPSPIKIDSPALRPPTPAIPADQFSGLMGIWSGSAVRPDNTLCRMRLELRTEHPGSYAAYSMTACGPAIPIHAITNSQRQVAAMALKQMIPLSVSFTGTAVNGALQFDKAQILGNPPNGCNPVALIVTPFGIDAISAQWKESGICQGGQMLLRKTSFAPYIH